MKRFTTAIVFVCLLYISSKSSNESSASEYILTGIEAHKMISGAEYIRMYQHTSVPAYIRFRGNSTLTEERAIEWLKGLSKSNQEGGFKLIRRETDELGITHCRYVQTYKGYEVFGTTYILHFKHGFLHSANGMLYDQLTINTSIDLKENIALQAALKAMNADVYKWQIPEEEKLARYEYEVEKIRKSPTYFPKGELKIIPANGDFLKKEKAFSLCYVFDIYADEPMDRKEVFVNATNGVVEFMNPLIMHGNANGKAKTMYSDTQNIVTDSVSPVYFRLRETGRGNGIETYNLNKGTNYGTATDFVDSNNFWYNVNANKDEYATDAHFGSEKTYDYFWNVHNRNSIDNAGFLLKSYVHYSTNFVNAFWDGTRMTYGDGNATYTPLVTTDIAGHEIAHGLTSNTSSLIYSYESGALNESFSDIFGVAIDFYARPNLANWLMGDGLGSAPFRSMSNPNAYGDPDCYLGTSWWTSTGDNGGVHTNSGVQNYWFYLMCNGGIGKNDKNDSFWVNKLGMDTAAKIAFRNNTYYLTPTSQYADARFYAIQSANDLYGGCSKAVISTTNAWHAVGVGARFDSTVKADFTVPSTSACAAPQKIRFINLSSNGSSYKWKFGTGDSSTTLNPTYTYNTNGKYTVSLIADGGACGIDTIVKTNYIDIDPHYDCIAYIGDSISNKCFGTLYDDGGSNNSYNTDTTYTFRISPTSATAIALNFLDFDVEAGTSSGVCDYDYVQLHNGTSTAATSLGKFCNTNKPNTSSYSTGANATIYMLSDPAATGRGFELKWQCTIPNAKPSVRYTASTFYTCTGVVNFTDQSYNTPTSWKWSFGDGNTSTTQHPSHTYLASGVYNVTLIATNAFGSDTFTKSAYISVNRSPVPSVSDTIIKRCGNGTISFNATGSGSIQWFDSLNSTTVLGSGNSFTSPVLTASKDYYLQSTTNNPNITYGALDTNIGTGGYHTAIPPAYMIFNATRPCKLVSVKVRANSTKNRRFQLSDRFGNVLKDTIININLGTQTVNLNFDIPMGINLRLGIHKDSSAGLYRNTAGASYPYTDTNGLISIKGHNLSTTAPTAYYYFYQWIVKENDCTSPRIKVRAKVQQPVVLKNLDTFNCSGSSIVLIPSGNDIDSIYWTTGNVSTSTRTVNPSSTSNYIYSAFNVCGEFKDTATVTALLNPNFTSVDNDTTICKGQSVRLKAKGSSTPFWKNISITDTSVLVSPTTSTNYPLEIINSCGTARDTIKVIVVDTPNLLARTDTSICNGSTILLTATSNFPIVWHPMNVTSSSVSANPISNSIYYAEVNATCGTKRDTVRISVLNIPTLEVSNDTLICNGTSAKLRASSSAIPLWSSISISDTMVNVSPTSNTIYPVEASNICGIARDTIIVTIQNKPTISISADSLTACVGNNIILSANSTHAIVWQPNGFLGSNNSVTASSTVKYFAESQNSCGMSRDSILLKVETSIPTLSTTPDTIVCNGQTIQLAASTNGSLYWNELASTANQVNVSPTIATKYTLQSSNTCGIHRDTIIVKVDTMPILHLSNDTSVCLGGAAKLNYKEGLMIQWQPVGIMLNTIYTVFPTKNTTYYATAINKCGSISDSVNVSIMYRPTIKVLNNDTTVCRGEAVNLTAVSNGNLRWLGFSPSPSIIVNPWTKTLYIAQADNSCGYTRDSALVDIFPQPISIASGNIKGKDVQFINNSKNALSYRWEFGDGTSDTSISPKHSYVQLGEYIVKLISNNQCGYDTLRMIVLLKSSSSVQQDNLSEIIVYPNPVQSTININGINKGLVRIYEITGREIMREKLISTSQKIDVSHLAKGNYVLHIESEEKQYQFKLTKE